MKTKEAVLLSFAVILLIVMASSIYYLFPKLSQESHSNSDEEEAKGDHVDSQMESLNRTAASAGSIIYPIRVNDFSNIPFMIQTSSSSSFSFSSSPDSVFEDGHQNISTGIEEEEEEVSSSPLDLDRINALLQLSQGSPANSPMFRSDSDGSFEKV
jgi:hypothetical protein